MSILARLSTNINRFKNIIYHGYLDPIEFYYSEKYKVIYVENAKVACTAIKTILFDIDIENEMDIHESVRELSTYELNESDFIVFTVVRSPFERLKSCYKDKILKSGSSKGKSIFDLFFYKVIFLVFSGKWLTNRTSFDDFVYMVSKTPDMLSDRHIRSQSCMLKKLNGTSNNFRFIKLENIDNWKFVEFLSHIPSPAKSNKTVSNTGARDKYFNSKNIELMSKRYSEDIDIFDYQFEHSVLVGKLKNESL